MKRAPHDDIFPVEGGAKLRRLVQVNFQGRPGEADSGGGINGFAQNGVRMQRVAEQNNERIGGRALPEGCAEGGDGPGDAQNQPVPIARENHLLNAHRQGDASQKEAFALRGERKDVALRVQGDRTDALHLGGGEHFIDFPLRYAETPGGEPRERVVRLQVLQRLKRRIALLPRVAQPVEHRNES